MATTSNILTLLKFNSSKQKTPMLEYEEFSDYVHRYAQHHMDENPDLVAYASTTYRDTLEEELNNLISERQIAIGSFRNKDFIYVVPYFIEKYAAIYSQIETNLSVPFPNINELPKQTPMDIVTKKQADELIYKLLEKEELSDKFLYCMIFTKNLPSLLYPSNVSMEKLLELSLHKVQEFLRKGESHDYFLKKLTISNPGKEISIKNFFTQFVTNPLDSLRALRENGDTFYYWSQLCYFIKQDYTKLKDFTPEDISILQSVSIIEISTSFIKSKTAKRIQKEGAFAQLDALMKNPPYYYDLDDILKMKDKTGIPLLGQYTEEELKEHLKSKTMESVGNQMPDLLVFRTVDDKGRYIYKDKVIPLVMRLCNEVRTLVRESLIKVWYRYLLEYETLDEMKLNTAFEKCLEREIRSADPILYSLLNASFLSVISFEEQNTGHIQLFRNGALIPYSEILMVSRQEILADARLKLPFWYTLPLISLILAFLHRKPKHKRRQDSGISASITVQNEQKELEEEKFHQRDEEDSFDQKKTRRRELRRQAVALEKEYVPDNSTLDRELKVYLREWNDRIGKENFNNLEEDINSLIRDYFRKTLRSLRSESFTKERISSLAQSLVDSPSMMKIKNHPALKMYAELYMIKIVKNLPSN